MPTFNKNLSSTQDVIRHVRPNAYVIFVPAFGNEIFAEDILVADSTKDVKEIASISISRTVRNSPGTFNITIRDPNNKFIIPDDPNTDIALMKAYSEKKEFYSSRGTRGRAQDLNVLTSARELKNKQVTTGSGSIVRPTTDVYIRDDYDPGIANRYNYSDYDQWSNDYYIVLEDVSPQGKGKRYPTQYLIKSGEVNERWAFDDNGDIIFVTVADGRISGVLSEQEMLNAFNSSTSVTLSLKVSTYKTSQLETREYILHMYTNKELVDGNFRDVAEQGETGFKKGRCKISPMDRIMIFMTPRFDENGNFNQSDSAAMIPVFTGVVNTAQQGYSDGAHTITVQGEDVTKYLRLSIINVNPALNAFGKEIAGQYPGENIHVWGHIFQGLSTPEIIRVLCLGTGALKNPRELKGQELDAIGFYKLSGKGSSAYEWKYDPVKEEWIANDSNKIARADFRALLGDLFGTSTVHICDPFRKSTLSLEGWRSYEMSLNNNWSFFQADFKTRRDIAYKAAEDSFFNFYADRSGNIWFHPQRFDISWILGAKNPKVYVIDNPSIISYGFVEDDSDLYTEVQVSTEPDFGMESLQDTGFYTGSYRSESDILKYGYRIFVGVNPIINTKVLSRSGSDIDQSSSREYAARSVKTFAKSLLKRILASKDQGQITIVGRPELDPGRPIYVPIRNMIYYVETVDHDVVFGNSYTTTLHLSYGRKPWEYLPELLTFSENDEVFLTASGLKKRREEEPDGESKE